MDELVRLLPGPGPLEVRPLRDALIEALPPLSELGRYALGRVLTASCVWDAERWSGASFGGADRLAAHLDRFRTLDDDDRLRLSLEAEYGTVLPELVRSRFVVTDADPRSLVRLSQTHRPAGHACFDPSEPVCLVTGHAGRRVVDGYHRLGSALGLGLRSVRVVRALPV